MLRRPSTEVLYLCLALLVACYGGLLRVDAYTQKYGTLERPGWARVLTNDVPPLVAYIRPSGFRWRPDPRPYVGGDPINYLRFSREMTSFYQPHVREPVFLAVTRAFLWLMSGQDAAVSFASMAGAVLGILGVFLLGAEVISPLSGLIAAFLVAGEYELITWAPDGWRDDWSAATVVLTAWAVVRAARLPTFGNALLVGTTGALACLTRITALSFVVPGLAWLLLDCPAALRRERAKVVGLSLLMLTVMVAPFLISCALATGDPFFSINYHTGFYRFGEGLPADQPMSAAEYLGSKFVRRPVAAIDTTVTGIVVQPFMTKWRGLEGWVPGLGAVLRVACVAGLLMLLRVASGRLLLVVLVTSLVPFAFTWNIAGGEHWRFTMHVYPLYIVAAVYAIDRACRFVVAAWHEPAVMTRALRPAFVVRALSVVAVLALLAGGYVALPWLVVREVIAQGDDVSIETGERDGVFFGSGWSPPHQDGVMVRVSRGERAIVRIPLPTRRSYDVVLRLDPVAPGIQERVSVLFNRQLVGRLRLEWDPQRVGAYRVRLPEKYVKAGINELAIVPETVVTAAAAGPRFHWLDSEDRIGVRLWYVRVLK